MVDNVWRIAPVSEEPAAVMTDWSVFETPEKTRHAVGYIVSHREGRVTSNIRDFDIAKHQIRTNSGRVYYLKGDCGHHHDAWYTWNKWCVINNVTTYEDVTNEYY